MEGLASSASGVMAREAPSKNAALSSIKEIDFRFKEENVQLAMIVQGNQAVGREVKTRNYNVYQSNVVQAMEEELKESGLNQYEIQAVTNLANIKIISRILTITMKKFLKKIDGFRASKIVQKLTGNPSETNYKWEEALPLARQKAEKIASQLTEAHDTVSTLYRSINFEIFEREKIIHEIHKQLLDNLQRKYLLVINELKLHYPEGCPGHDHTLVTQVSQFIHNLDE